ncbi:hypothetical protein CPC08DRAFT_755414 [Agrocybe pediades]|nr:hypothetical protein CPC08DRAFT_755414 [Agrocybe pediades]
MPIRPSIDDTNTTLIEYQGNWQAMLGGSSRQWESSVHSTISPGASATFTFIGYQVWMWGTNPAGTGSNLLDVSIDGAAPTSLSQTSNGSAVYNVLYFNSSIMTDSLHQIVVTNRGSTDNGHTEFLLDRFEFETAADVVAYPTSTPAFSSPTGGPSSSSSGAGATPGPGSNPPTAHPVSKSHTGVIAGTVIGVLALLVLALAYLLWRRRRQNKLGVENPDKRMSIAVPPNRSEMLAPMPFPLTQTDSNTEPRPSRLAEKAAYHAPQAPALAPPAAGVAAAQADGASPRIGPRPVPSSTSLATSSDMYTSTRPVSSGVLDMEDNIPHVPPPSYS